MRDKFVGWLIPESWALKIILEFALFLAVLAKLSYQVWGMDGLLLIYAHKVSFPCRAEKILLSKDQLQLLLDLADTEWEAQCVALMTMQTVLHVLAY